MCRDPWKSSEQASLGARSNISAGPREIGQCRHRLTQQVPRKYLHSSHSLSRTFFSSFGSTHIITLPATSIFLAKIIMLTNLKYFYLRFPFGGVTLSSQKGRTSLSRSQGYKPKGEMKDTVLSDCPRSPKSACYLISLSIYQLSLSVLFPSLHQCQTVCRPSCNLTSCCLNFFFCKMGIIHLYLPFGN